MLTKAALTAETLAAVLAQSSDCVLLLDLEGRLIWMNRSGLDQLEIEDFAQVSGSRYGEGWCSHCRGEMGQALQVAGEGNQAHLRVPCTTFKGSPRWWDIGVSAVSDKLGKQVGFVVIQRDVSQIERDREAMATLVAEMRHRLRNSYALVCSLMSGHARHDAGRTEFAREMSERIMALAAAQSLFEDGQEHGELDALVRALVEPFAGGLVEDFSVEVPTGIAIGRRTADAIALVLGELGVNAVKYGAAGRGGSLRVTANVDDGAIRIRWLECHDGREPAPANQRSSGGQGLSIIQRIVASRQGAFATEIHENGLVAELLLPLIGPAGLSAQD